jgi:DNA-binding MarR family transcriptional regulator
MPGHIQEEIKQQKPMTPEQEAILTVQRTADAFQRQFSEVLKPHGISGTQYNVLRILRGAGKDGLPCGSVAERMVTRDPDITRLLDRLDKMGYITRSRDTLDRRVVTTRITEDGLKLLKKLDKPAVDLEAKLLGHMTKSQLRTLVDLLDQARGSHS